MNRRDFLKGVTATAAIPSIPGVVYAEPVSLATVSAAFSLASAVTGFMTRGSNPKVPLLISIAQAVEALGMKIDGIDHKLDLMLKEIFEIRRLIEDLPYNTNLLGASVSLREPYTAFLELQPHTQVDQPSSSYLRAVAPIRERMRSARIKYLDLVGLRPEPGFEAVIQLALAQDAELILAAEMQRPEMHDLGLTEDIRGTLGTVKAYGEFFEAAMDPNQAGSLTSLKASIAKRVSDQLKQQIKLGRVGPTSAWDTPKPPRSVELKFLLDTGQTRAVCGNDGGPLCIQRGDSFRAGCAEPGHRTYYDLVIDINDSPIASVDSSIDDTLRRPTLYEARSDMVCGNHGVLSSSPPKDSIDKALEILNLDIARYYKIHYAHGVCELARDINARQQRILHDLM